MEAVARRLLAAASGSGSGEPGGSVGAGSSRSPAPTPLASASSLLDRASLLMVRSTLALEGDEGPLVCPVIDGVDDSD